MHITMPADPWTEAPPAGPSAFTNDVSLSLPPRIFAAISVSLGAADAKIGVSGRDDDLSSRPSLALDKFPLKAPSNLDRQS